MKKKENIIETIVNKELEKYNVNYNYVLANPIIDGEPWFQHYTMTQEEYIAWEKFCMDFLMKNMKPRPSKITAEKKFLGINLCFGLKIKEN
jgi:hypothetical protein